MARPSNSIATIKMPGESTRRPIIPYAVGVNSNNSYQATLPTLTADDTIVIGSIVANEYVDGGVIDRYAKGDYCKHEGFLYRAKAPTHGT